MIRTAISVASAAAATLMLAACATNGGDSSSGAAQASNFNLPAGLSVPNCEAEGGLGGRYFAYLFATNNTDTYFNANFTIEVLQKGEVIDTMTSSGQWSPGQGIQIASGEGPLRYDADANPVTCRVTEATAS